MFYAYNSNHLITFLFFFTVSIAAFGMLMGSLVAGPFANLIGRQWASIIGSCGCLAIGYSLFAGAQYVWMMLLGRLMHGAGLGFSTTVSTLYIMEVRIIFKFGVVDPLFTKESCKSLVASTASHVTYYNLPYFLPIKWPTTPYLIQT